MDEKSQADLRKGCEQARILVLAITGNSLVLVVLGEILKRTSPPFRGMPDFEHVDILRYVLAGVTLLEVYLLRVFEGQPISMKWNTAGGRSPFGQFSTITQQLIARHIAKAMLCFSVSVFGMLLFLIAVKSADLYGFLAMSLLLQAIHLPRYERWKERARSPKVWRSKSDVRITSDAGKNRDGLMSLIEAVFHARAHRVSRSAGTKNIPVDRVGP